MREEQGGNEGQEGGRERPTSGEVGQEQRPLKGQPGGEPSTETACGARGETRGSRCISFPNIIPSWRPHVQTDD